MARFEEPTSKNELSTRCEECNGEIMNGQSTIFYDSQYFCDMDCFMKYIGAEETYLDLDN